MMLSIRALLESELISSDQISRASGVPIEIIEALKHHPKLIIRTPDSMLKPLYDYYLNYQDLFKPYQTYLSLLEKYDIKHLDNDLIFLDFYETKEAVENHLGKKDFQQLTNTPLEKQSTPFFLLTYIKKVYLFHLDEYELLIKKLNELKQINPG